MRYAYLKIGINGYRDAPLQGCKNDLSNFSAAVQGFGLDVSHSVRLTDKKATAKTCRVELSKLATMPDDYFVFQYSGHGSRIPDNSGDEATLTGYDQVIVPYDYQSAGFILDDELGGFAASVEAAGKRALVILDSCYSGFSSFAFPGQSWLKSKLKMDTARALPDYLVTRDAIEATWTEIYDSPGTMGLPRAGFKRQPMPGIDNAWLIESPVIFIEMARHDETAADAYIQSEKAYHGAGTYALCYQWRLLGRAASYLEIVTKANQWLRDRGYQQRIQIEGRLDLLGKPFLT